MALDQTIDSAVEEFNKSLTEAQDLFIEDVTQLQEEGLSTEEILLILAGISMADYWLQDLQMQKAITMRYGIGEEVSEPMSMTAIGQTLNMSRDRVRNLLEKGITALRQNSEKIKDYL